MLTFPSDIAFTPAVKAVQTKQGSRASYARMESGGSWETTVTPELEAFLADLDMFYLGTANAAGQPYIQYRGGSPGFLKTVDQKTLGFADFGGNRQYITLGNLSENPQAFIFLMDYARARRIKLWGTARVVDDDAVLLDRLRDPSYSGKVERAILFEIEAWDVNCPQHIHKRFSQRQVAPVIEQLEGRIAELEAEVRRLNGEHDQSSQELQPRPPAKGRSKNNCDICLPIQQRTPSRTANEVGGEVDRAGKTVRESYGHKLTTTFHESYEYHE